jgi:hypothetical protein
MLLNAMARAARIGWSCLKKEGRNSKGYRIPAATGMSVIL